MLKWKSSEHAPGKSNQQHDDSMMLHGSRFFVRLSVKFYLKLLLSFFCRCFVTAGWKKTSRKFSSLISLFFWLKTNQCKDV